MGERAGYNISYDIDNKIATKLSLAIFPAVVSFPMLDVRTWPSPHLTVLTDISASPLSSPLILISPRHQWLHLDDIRPRKKNNIRNISSN